MAKEKNLFLDGIPIGWGRRKALSLRVSEDFTARAIHVPVIVLRGSEEGPVLFITAAIHGDELNGIAVVRQLAYRIQPADLRGTLLLIPVLNVEGFYGLSRYAADERDLNRYFPGHPAGSTTARICHTLYRKIFSHCHYGIDIHTAAAGRTNLPHVRADMKVKEVARLARAFGVEVVLDHPGEPGSLRYGATRQGIPTLTLEIGEALRFQRRYIRLGVQGCLNILAALRMWKGKPLRPRHRVILKRAVWVRSDRGGILELNVRSGSLVEKGEIMARTTRPIGSEHSVIRSPVSGLVLSVTALPMAAPGYPVAHLGVLKKSFRQVKAWKRRGEFLPRYASKKGLALLERPLQL